MKRKFSILLVIVMIVATMAGCNIVERDYERDFAREVVVIKSVDYNFDLDKPVYNDFGVADSTTPKSYTYVSPEIKIYKSTLNNYVYSLLSQKLNTAPTVNKAAVNKAIEEILEDIIEYELTLIEADRLFFAGEIYWTRAEIDQLQRDVYSVIDSELLTLQNEILTSRNKDTIPQPAQQEPAPETTYPVKPQKQENEEVRPSYYFKNGDSFNWYYSEPANPEYQWHDQWYTDDTWYIEEQSKYLTSYPGVFGTADQKSLEKEALSRYIVTLSQNIEGYIGITDAQLAAVKAELNEINKVKDTLGVEYTYPMLGKSLLVKLLVGDTYLKNAKVQKLQAYIEGNVSVSYSEVADEFERQLNNQKTLFENVANYDTAVKDGTLTLFTPTNRYVFVKHILLPFSKEQEAALKAEKERLGTNEEAIEAYRAQLAKQITSYEHVDGEDDLTKPAKSADQIFAEVKATMERFKNNPKYAERAFDDLIYKYNTDPGIFDNRYGYGVVYKLNDNESETYMVEFAEGARAFRDEGYSVGQVLDNYVITDYGIHIMYYAGDPKPLETKYLNSYTSAGQYETVYDTIRETLLSNKKTDVYNLYIANRVAQANRNSWLTQYDKILNGYKKEIVKAVL